MGTDNKTAAGAILLFLAAAAGVFHGDTPLQGDVEAAYRANNVGVARLEQFDYEAAAAAFRQALALHPSLDAARLNHAIALFYGGKTAEAAKEAQAAAGRLPGAPQAHFVSGLIARSEDRLDEARDAFERVLKIDPADGATKVNLGQIALQQRQYDRALPLFREALAAEPYNVTAAYNVALALMRSGQADEGRKAMQRFEGLRDSLYGVTYSQTYLGQGKYAEAIASTGAEPELVLTTPPGVTFADATAAMLPSERPLSGAARGGLTLFDADADGDLDLFEAGGTAQRFLRNQNGVFSFDTARAGLTAAGEGTRLGAIAGDYDNDGRADLVVLMSGSHRLFRQNASGVFEDAGALGSGAGPGADQPIAAAFADVDHDGDLDVVIGGGATRLFRNNGNGTFADVAAQSGMTAATRAFAIAATDYDNRRDIDLLFAASQGPPILYRNMRDGTFRDAAADAGLPGEGSYSALAAGDVNKDGSTDFFLGRPDRPGLLALSDGQARFRAGEAPAESRAAVAAQFLDYDNDGLLDLLTVAARGARLFRNAGAAGWQDVSAASGVASREPGGSAFQALALGDLDGDGDTDAALRLANGDLRIWRNDGGHKNASLRVRLAARVSNRGAIGAKVEMRAGSLRQQLETSAGSPAVAPADITFGLGQRASADVVRVLWPSGILQAETGTAASPLKPGVTPIAELDRKPSSCPYLFTWNGSRFEFVTDFMGGSEMGAWMGPGAWNVPDPDEYVRIAGGQLKPRDGRYELRVTNELEEALFVDRLQLVAVDHRAGVDVFPNEGLRSAPRPPLALTASRDARPPVRAVDGHGHDVLDRLARIDRAYPDDFRLLPIRGYAEPHTLTLDLGDAADSAVLLMTGWTDYAFSNDNVAASQRGVTMRPPSVEVRNAAGAWQTVVSETGFPVGRPQTIVVDLKGKWLSAAREVRISTNMRIYWDRILVDTSGGAAQLRVTRLDPSTATLRWRGFSTEVSPDGREPFGYDYSRVSASSPWKVLVGRYTREGDVEPLLRREDDMYVISRPGDELAVAFEERALPALDAGWERTFLLYAHGWSKEMNPRSAEPDLVGPLPFAAMSGYPYGPGEHYPRTKAHREYQERYNTRVVPRGVPSIDASVR